MGKLHTHYDNLKVSRDAPEQVIKAAYKEEIVKWVKSNGEYEPLGEADPRNCWWDWD
jgi:hypothetical protein